MALGELLVAPVRIKVAQYAVVMDLNSLGAQAQMGKLWRETGILNQSFGPYILYQTQEIE